MENKVYYTKIDWWLFCLPFLFIICNLLFMPLLMRWRDALAMAASVFFIMLIVCAFVMYFGKNTKYILESDGLRIYTPIFYNFFIPYAEIHSVEKSRNSLSAPAFSQPNKNKIWRST